MKSILSDNHRTRVKSHVDNFNVPIGIYIYDMFGRIVNLEQMGFYQDDRIIFIPDSNGPKTSEIQKKIIRAFKLQGLQIEISSNLKIIDFLDVTLNLNNGTFKTFSKSNSTPTYMNIDSNHPRSILKQILNAVNQMINRLSSCTGIFKESKSIYDEALKNSRFKGRLEYVNPMHSGSNGRSNSCETWVLIKLGDTNNRQGKKRNRRAIWFNPPFSKLIVYVCINRFVVGFIFQYFLDYGFIVRFI